MVENCFEVAAFCVGGALLAILLRQYCREQAMLISIGICGAVILGFLTILNPLLDSTRELFETAGMSSSYISLVFKAAAICFITQIICELCRDSGEGGIASAAELWGRGSLAVISLPMLEALVETVNSFL